MTKKMYDKKKYMLKLNSIGKLQELLQELYDEANKMIGEVQEQINKISSSVSLNQEAMDAKVKYAKAMNDFLSNKDKALGRKMDIAKLMAEVYKYNGNVKTAIQETDINWDDFKVSLNDTHPGDTGEETVRTYTLGKGKM